VAFLDPNLPFLANVENPKFFTSPFPSTYGSEKLSALGGLAAPAIASAGATAWAVATQIAMKAKAVHVGDLRTDWLSKMVSEDPKTGAFTGIFAMVNFPNSADRLALEKAMVNTGFDVAGGIVSAVPVYGQIIAAVLDVSQFFYNLFRQSEEQQKVLVPWEAYSQGLDEDLCKSVVFPAMEVVDWTRVFWPSLDYKTGWRMFETDEGSLTRAWGTFPPEGGAARYTTDAPGSEFGGGLGFMPGTQRMADIIQLAIYGKYKGPTARVDAITDVGNFYPATAQTCTALWEMVMKSGSPDMYKVRAGQVKEVWDAYFDAMRQSFTDEWNWRWAKGYAGTHREEVVNLGKLMSPYLSSGGGRLGMEGLNSRWIWPGMTRSGGSWQPDPKDGRPACPPSLDGEGWYSDGWLSDPQYQAGAHWPPDRCFMQGIPQPQKDGTYRYIDNFVIEPACADLKLAQHRALYRTVVAAYVRPNPIQGLERYGAFNDTSAPIESGYDTFGEELRARCLHAREALLGNDLRFSIRLEDVDAIDPPYAEQLRASGVDENSWKRPVALSFALGPSEPVPASRGPMGGAPFGGGPPSGGGGGLILAGAAAVAAFAMLKGR